MMTCRYFEMLAVRLQLRHSGRVCPGKGKTARRRHNEKAPSPTLPKSPTNVDRPNDQIECKLLSASKKYAKLVPAACLTGHVEKRRTWPQEQEQCRTHSSMNGGGGEDRGRGYQDDRPGRPIKLRINAHPSPGEGMSPSPEVSSRRGRCHWLLWVIVSTLAR